NADGRCQAGVFQPIVRPVFFMGVAANPVEIFLRVIALPAVQFDENVAVRNSRNLDSELIFLIVAQRGLRAGFEIEDPADAVFSELGSGRDAGSSRQSSDARMKAVEPGFKPLENFAFLELIKNRFK